MLRSVYTGREAHGGVGVAGEDGGIQQTLGVLLERSKETLDRVRSIDERLASVERGQVAHEGRIASLEEWRRGQEQEARDRRTAERQTAQASRTDLWDRARTYGHWIVLAAIGAAEILFGGLHPFSRGPNGG